MCAVGFDRRCSLTSFGWPGENASPSLQRRESELYDGMVSLTGASSLKTDSYHLNARLLLTEEFEELEAQSRQPIASLKLYLTDTELIVAKFTVDFLSEKESLTHLRTHSLKDVDVEVDAEDTSVMCLQTNFGTKFFYRLKTGATGLSSWMNRIFRLKRSSVSPSSSNASTVDERTDQQVLPLPANLPAASVGPIPVHQLSQPNHHSPDFCSLPQPDIIETKSNHETTETNNLLNSPGKKSVPLQRREAFRAPDLDSFRNSTRIRSSSAPPEPSEEQLEMLTKSPTSISSSKDVDLSVENAEDPFGSPSRHSSLRKGKLKISPRARKFTRALSARLIHTPVNSSPLTKEEKPVEVRRAKSLNANILSSTLPRSTKFGGKKERRRKSKSFFLESQDPSVPNTPTKPKSPGSILKLFHRKATSNSLNLEELISSIEDTELTELDLHNKPNHFKLYLQNPRTLAEELTLIDAEMFRNIDISELQNGAWTKKAKYSTSPNILKMIDSFNRLARVVCTEIVHEKTVGARAKAITSYIQVVGKLYKMHNYNSMKAVMAGLQSQAVYRLNRSWSQVPSRRKRKYEKYAKILCELDNPDQLQRLMQHNMEHRIKNIPYLGWLLTSVLHSQTRKKLQEEREVVPLRHHMSITSCAGDRNLRASVCSFSLPSSPVPSDTEEAVSNMIAISPRKKNHALDCVLFAKSLSESNIAQFVEDIENSPAYAFDTPESPRDEVDFGLQPMEKYSNSHPLPVNGTTEVDRPVSFNNGRHTSSGSSVEDSVQTDSAIGLDSSIGQPSPAHENQSELHKLNRDRTIHFSSSVNQRLRSESIPSFELDGEYVLPPVDSNFDDEDESDAEESTVNCCSSFMGTSSSPSPSPLSPSMISFSLTSEPNTEHSTPQKTRKRSRLTSMKPGECELIPSNSTEPDKVLYNSTCGVMFSSCPNSSRRIDSINFLFLHSSIPFKMIIQDFFDGCENITDITINKTNQADNAAKSSTPVSSVSNDVNTSNGNNQMESVPSSIGDESSSCVPRDNQTPTSPPVQQRRIEDEKDNVFLQYQRNTLNYTHELSSKGYMRCLINHLPWLDENQCHQVSMEVEPS